MNRRGFLKGVLAVTYCPPLVPTGAAAAPESSPRVMARVEARRFGTEAWETVAECPVRSDRSVRAVFRALTDETVEFRGFLLIPGIAPLNLTYYGRPVPMLPGETFTYEVPQARSTGNGVFLGSDDDYRRITGREPFGLRNIL